MHLLITFLYLKVGSCPLIVIWQGALTLRKVSLELTVKDLLVNDGSQ